jgi:hypothetical protein
VWKRFATPIRSLADWRLALTTTVEPKVLKEWTLQTLKITDATKLAAEHSETLLPNERGLSYDLWQLCQESSRNTPGITRQYRHSGSMEPPDLVPFKDLVREAARLAIIIRSCRREYYWPMHECFEGTQRNDLQTNEAYGFEGLDNPILVFAPVYTGSSDFSDWKLLMKGTALLPREKY